MAQKVCPFYTTVIDQTFIDERKVDIIPVKTQIVGPLMHGTDGQHGGTSNWNQQKKDNRRLQF